MDKIANECKQTTSTTPLINKESHKSNVKRPQLVRTKTIDKIDAKHKTYDSQGNYKYKYKKWCGIRRSTCLLALLLIFYGLFVFFGATVMSGLEEDNLQDMKMKAIKLKKNFAQRNNMDETVVEELISKIVDFESSGGSMLDSNLNKTEWNLRESVLFVVTTLTTIGKHNINPNELL